MIWYDKESTKRASRFRRWMDIKGHPVTTTNSYSSALKNTCKKLTGLKSVIHLDLFEYATVDDFQNAYNVIINAHNYEEIKIADHGALAAAMKKYIEFLNYEKIKEIALPKDGVLNPPVIAEKKVPMVDGPLLPSETTNKCPAYSKEYFLDEVFLNDSDYEILTNLLSRKKNLILQGPPGVGKTFAAKRLAFSIMGEKDETRVATVQFHQSYSYEDFVMGFRPSGNGFQLSYGPFYKFCLNATKDPNRPFFFIIDEINRGNLSKIFGELLMLIEHDKRGIQYATQLLYKDEPFMVPENVYILGMMNTADRSLAMIDYALRRRFAFFDLNPAFQSEGFKRIQSKLNNQKFNSLVSAVQSLNVDIESDASLGTGFQIGHSYLCVDSCADDTLKAIVEYELIPLITEYWFDEPSKVFDWSSRLRTALNG